MLVPNHLTMLDCLHQEMPKSAARKKAYVCIEEEMIEPFLPIKEDALPNDIYSNNVVFTITRGFFTDMTWEFTFAQSDAEKENLKKERLDMAGLVDGIRGEINKAIYPLSQDKEQHVIQVLFAMYCFLTIDIENPELSDFCDKIRGNIRDYIRSNDANAPETLMQLNQCVKKLQKHQMGVDDEEENNGESTKKEDYCIYIVPNAPLPRDEIEAELARVAAAGKVQRFVRRLLTYERLGYLNFLDDEPRDIYEYLNKRYNLDCTDDHFIRCFRLEKK